MKASVSAGWHHLPESSTVGLYPACNSCAACVLVANIVRGEMIYQQVIMTTWLYSHLSRSSLPPPPGQATGKERKMATGWRTLLLLSGNEEEKKKKNDAEGSEVTLHRGNVSEREGRKAKTSSPCTGVLQGDNNYFLSPSSVTLSAAPSLETLHETHGSKTKHERTGSQCMSHTRHSCANSQTDTTQPVGTVHTSNVCVCVWCGSSHLGMAGTRLPFSSIKWPPALRTQRWWRDMRACLAVVGVSFPSWLSAFFSGENSSSRNTSYTTNVLGKTHGNTRVTERVSVMNTLWFILILNQRFSNRFRRRTI